jgi:hypothetical protein
MEKLLEFALLFAFTLTAAGQRLDQRTEIVAPKNYRPLAITNSIGLQTVLEQAVDEAVRKYDVKPGEIAATLIRFSIDPSKPSYDQAEVNGEQPIYPASVVKLFYMVALERQLVDKKVTDTPELQRGLRGMIVDSSNDATQYIVDVLTGTSSGPEFPKKDFEAWQFKRNRMNRYFASMAMPIST